MISSSGRKYKRNTVVDRALWYAREMIFPFQVTGYFKYIIYFDYSFDDHWMVHQIDGRL